MSVFTRLLQLFKLAKSCPFCSPILVFRVAIRWLLHAKNAVWQFGRSSTLSVILCRQHPQMQPESFTGRPFIIQRFWNKNRPVQMYAGRKDIGNAKALAFLISMNNVSDLNAFRLTNSNARVIESNPSINWLLEQKSTTRSRNRGHSLEFLFLWGNLKRA